jgi:hypothetical protein
MCFFYTFVYICYSKKQNLCTNLFKNFIQAGHVALHIIIAVVNALLGFLQKRIYRDRKIALLADRYTYSIEEVGIFCFTFRF